jgi:RIO-like serine/threonine protein kinase
MKARGTRVLRALYYGARDHEALPMVALRRIAELTPATVSRSLSSSLLA